MQQPIESIPLHRTIIYSFQWMVFNVVNFSVIPIIVGTALGLDQTGIAELAQRTMFFASLASLLQVLFGHRLTIFEGPAGMWWAIFITLAVTAPAMGKDLAQLRTDLELGVLVAGAFLVLLGVTGLIGRTLKLFTPAVTGTVLVMLALQLAGTFIKGMLGITAENSTIDPKATFVSLLVITIIIVLSLKGRGFIRSIAIIIGMAVGWVVAVMLGLDTGQDWVAVGWFQMPVLFAWGTPTFDLGIIMVSILTALLVLSNLVASILAMERTLGIELKAKDYDRGVAFTGVADMLAGVGATVGVVPYSGSAGLVAITGVNSKKPFILFTVMMMIMGLVPPVGQFLTSVPGPVGYAVALAAFCQMLSFGLKDYARLEMNDRQAFVVGIPLIVGVGILSVPATAFTILPSFLRYIMGNGFIVCMLLSLLMEHVLLPEKYFGEQSKQSK